MTVILYFRCFRIIVDAMGERMMSYEKLAQVRSRIIIGLKQTQRAMKNHEVSEVFVAVDADEHLVEQVTTLAKELDIPVTQVDSMKKLGEACGIDVGTSTAAIRIESST